MTEDKTPLSDTPAAPSPRVRKLLWAGAIAAAIMGLMAAAPPTRTEPVPWTGWVGV